MSKNDIKLYIIIDFDGIGTFYENAIKKEEYDADGFVDFLANKPIFSGSGNKSLIISSDTNYKWVLCNLQELDSYDQPKKPLELNCIKFNSVDKIGNPEEFWFSIFERSENITVNGNELILVTGTGCPSDMIEISTVKKIGQKKINLLYTINFNFQSGGETKVGSIDPIIDNRTDPEG